MKATTKQIGGNHYIQYKYQPILFFLNTNINFALANAIKYVARYPNKGINDDLEKACHYLDIFFEHISDISLPSTLDISEFTEQFPEPKRDIIKRIYLLATSELYMKLRNLYMNKSQEDRLKHVKVIIHELKQDIRALTVQENK